MTDPIVAMNPIKGYIGIFWIYKGVIYSFKETLDQVSTVGEFKDSDMSHDAKWPELQNAHKDFYLYEYYDVPRGRIVYNVNEDRFLVYAHGKIIDSLKFREMVITEFELESEKTVFGYDHHYG